MASDEVKATLVNLEDPANAYKDKSVLYSALLDKITSGSSTTRAGDLTNFIESILGETLGVVASRALLASAVKAITLLPSPTEKIAVGTSSLTCLEPRVVSFEEQDAQLRYILADAYEAQDEWIESAKVLQGINLESSQRKISDKDRVETWVRICRLYLEDDDPTTAESYLNRAKNIIYKLPASAGQLKLLFQLSQARIQDSQRKFLDASSAYHSISFNNSVDEEERLQTLSSAITCAVLAPAGPARSRTLAKLYKDERAPQVPEYGILEKMFLDRLLSAEEVDKFASGLAPHQVARTSDGSTVLARAVVEHNLLSASRLYANIGFVELGGLLNLTTERAEETASAMLQQGRLTGQIDQVGGVLLFDQTPGSSQPAGRELRKWDAKVQGVAEEVENVASMLMARQPVSLISMTY